jgi:hypothetical protein
VVVGQSDATRIMGNALTLVLLFLVFYLVPLALMFVRRIWIKVYFVVVFAAVLLLGYEAHVAFKSEDDCRAGCALAMSAMVLTIATVVTGSLLAMLSAWGVNRWRTFMANKRLQPIAREDAHSG